MLKMGIKKDRTDSLFNKRHAIFLMDAEDRDRTGTVVTYRRILSPVRLPIPPPRHMYVLLYYLRRQEISYHRIEHYATYNLFFKNYNDHKKVKRHYQRQLAVPRKSELRSRTFYKPSILREV